MNFFYIRAKAIKNIFVYFVPFYFFCSVETLFDKRIFPKT